MGDCNAEIVREEIHRLIIGRHNKYEISKGIEKTLIATAAEIGLMVTSTKFGNEYVHKGT